MGQVAARWAIDLATGGERPMSHRLQVRLVVRHSSSARRESGVFNGGSSRTSGVNSARRRARDAGSGSAG
jgi:hypothetical protein